MNTKTDSHSRVDFITVHQTKDSIYKAFEKAYEVWIDKENYLKFVEGGEIDYELGGEYKISLLHFENSDDLTIYGDTGVDYEKEFDRFWILFSSNDRSKAESFYDELVSFFEEHYGKPKFKESLRDFLITLEIR